MTPTDLVTTPAGQTWPDDAPTTPDLRGLDAFTVGYIRAALWSSTDESRDDGGGSLDEHYSIEDIEPGTLLRMRLDCQTFQLSNEQDLWQRSSEYGGHDFWLTRNGHGAGFWDGDWPDDAARRLTRSAGRFGTFDLYVGDDGRVYGS